MAANGESVWRRPRTGFLGSRPLEPDAAATPVSPSGMDVLIAGLPFDSGASFRRGAAAGPGAIRGASLVLEEYSLALGRDLRSLEIGDAGDLEAVGWETVPVGGARPDAGGTFVGAADAPPTNAAATPPHRSSETQTQCSGVQVGADAYYESLSGPLGLACRRHLRPGGMLVTLGGDHSVSYAAVAAVQRWLAGLATGGLTGGLTGELPVGSAGGLSVLVLDAHADLRQGYGGSRWSHACASARLLELTGPGRLQQAGIRSAERTEVDAGARAGLEWAARAATGPYLDSRALAEQAIAALDLLPADGPLYLSVDLDVADPAYAPGVGAPEPGGPGAADLLVAVIAVARRAGKRLAGLDVVEVTPSADPASITAVLAAKVVREAILARAAG